MPRTIDALETSQRWPSSARSCSPLAAGVTAAVGANDVARFVLAGLALAALAAVVGQAIEQVGETWARRHGLLQSTLGNLPELFVAIFALREGLTTVVQAALVGSVLANVVLVLGIAFVSGGARHGTQHFDPEEPRLLATLLILAVAALLVPTLADRLHTPAAHHTQALSDACAIVLLLVYAASVPFYLGRRTRHRGRNCRDQAAGGARPALTARRARGGRSAWPSSCSLFRGTSAAASDWFVSAAGTGRRPPSDLARVHRPGHRGHRLQRRRARRRHPLRRGKPPEYAISTTLNSPLRWRSADTGPGPAQPVRGPSQLTLVFPPLLVAALAVTVVVAVVIIYDGEYTWIEGVA